MTDHLRRSFLRASNVNLLPTRPDAAHRRAEVSSGKGEGGAATRLFPSPSLMRHGKAARPAAPEPSPSTLRPRRQGHHYAGSPMSAHDGSGRPSLIQPGRARTTAAGVSRSTS